MAKATHCAACGHKPTALNKLIEARDGKFIHKSHTTDSNSGYYGKAR